MIISRNDKHLFAACDDCVIQRWDLELKAVDTKYASNQLMVWFALCGFVSDHVCMMSLSFAKQTIWPKTASPSRFFLWLNNILSFFYLTAMWKFWFFFSVIVTITVFFIIVVRDHHYRQT